MRSSRRHQLSMPSGAWLGPRQGNLSLLASRRWPRSLGITRHKRLICPWLIQRARRECRHLLESGKCVSRCVGCLHVLAAGGTRFLLFHRFAISGKNQFRACVVGSLAASGRTTKNDDEACIRKYSGLDSRQSGRFASCLDRGACVITSVVATVWLRRHTHNTVVRGRESVVWSKPQRMRGKRLD